MGFSEPDERVQLLAKLKQVIADSEESNRLKDEFLATIAHELRTPLTAIAGWVQLARTGRLHGDQLTRALEIIDRNTVLESRLIADILEISRMILGKIEIDFDVIDLRPVVQAGIDSIRPTTAAKGIVLDATLEQVPAIYGNDSRLQQILWNLLMNAVKFTPREGTVSVSLNRTGTDVMIRISDTGDGIKPECLPWIFERFRQAHSSSVRQHGGLGLGLAIVRHLVELHGGTVSVESGGEGSGAAFTVALPCYSPELAKSLDLQASKPRAAPLKGIHVLVAEADDDMRLLIQGILEAGGAQVEALVSTAEAFKVLEAAAPDVLVACTGMPAFNGDTLVGRLRVHDKTRGRITPAIAMSAFAAPIDQEAALAAGFQLHMAKPFEPELLTTAVSGLVREYHEKKIAA